MLSSSRFPSLALIVSKQQQSKQLIPIAQSFATFTKADDGLNKTKERRLQRGGANKWTDGNKKESKKDFFLYIKRTR